ncbi:MAG: 6-bladed beta-propeller [Bacteroidetes bacterium]|nr:6-bladed beta-propeller [Bacteroidota bacterium]
MKTTPILNSTAIIIITLFCFSCRQIEPNVPCIDLRKTYHEKEILLTDIADVTYLHLHANDEDYLYRGYISTLTTHTVVIADYWSGNILFFNKDGTPKSRFNRKGNGPGEYRSLSIVYYEEDADDVYVSSFLGTRILVYSSEGKFKREISLPQGTRVDALISFDDTSFFFYDGNMEIMRSGRGDKELLASDLISPFYLISKKDGTVLDYVELPVKPIFLGINYEGEPLSDIITRQMKCTEGVLLCNPENDTVFLYGKDRVLTPILHKIPFADATDPMTYLNCFVDLGDFQFIEIYTVRQGDIYPGIFPAKYYIRNKKSGEIFQQKLLLPDYKGKEFIISPTQSGMYRSGNDFIFELDLFELKQAYSENRLNGKLKELVAELKEEDNNVYAVASFK